MNKEDLEQLYIFIKSSDTHIRLFLPQTVTPEKVFIKNLGIEIIKSASLSPKILRYNPNIYYINIEAFRKDDLIWISQLLLHPQNENSKAENNSSAIQNKDLETIKKYFYELRLKDISELEIAIKSKDHKETELIAHRISGSAALLKFETLAMVARHIESNAIRNFPIPELMLTLLKNEFITLQK